LRHLARGKLELQLGGCVSGRTAVTARGSGRSTPPTYDSLLGDGGNAVLVSINHEWEECAEAVVGIVGAIVEGSLAVLESLHRLVDKGSDVVRLAEVIPRYNLNKFGLVVDNLVPAVEPQAVATPQPVLVPSRQVGVEPRGSGHHVRLASGLVERKHVRSVDVRVHVLVTPRPCRPVEKAVDNASSLSDGSEGTLRRPVRHEEALGAGLDIIPLLGTIRSFKGRQQRLVVEAVVGRLAAEIIAELDDGTFGEGSESGIVVREEELEALAGGYGEGDVQRIGKLGKLIGDIESEGVDVGVLGKLDVLLPVRLRVGL